MPVSKEIEKKVIKQVATQGARFRALLNSMRPQNHVIIPPVNGTSKGLIVTVEKIRRMILEEEAADKKVA